ncbi:arsenic resistance protein [Gordonia sp. HY442]|uniref:bile acid:sodium symporter n=1 Tax=Gordonia zhenghanii TaxID=2911516 RepID=UPI001F293D72|nr:bile acid:sodium symporter [Gordonia zhenghanii]MCF8604756.1 arsenic resistance protein [Gordonia zhenghanii]
MIHRHQIAICLAGLALGAILGLLVPSVSGPATVAIDPLLVALLYATFLGIPFGRIGQAMRDGRFLAAVFVVNFAVVPVVVFALSRIVAHDRALLVGVLFVLLAPCVDYVIVFSSLAGGATDRLLASAPLLMLVQMVALPAYLWLFVGSDVASAIDVGPFVRAFVLIVAAPMVLAGLTQWAAAHTGWGRGVERVVAEAMVPIMALTLVAVVASQIADVRDEFSSLAVLIPVYVMFAIIMVPVGMGVGRLAGLDVPGVRSVAFSGVTRNSLVVLPLVLALPAEFGPVPLVVVTQTLVELVVMVVMVRTVPRLVT